LDNLTLQQVKSSSSSPEELRTKLPNIYAQNSKQLI